MREATSRWVFKAVVVLGIGLGCAHSLAASIPPSAYGQCGVLLPGPGPRLEVNLCRFGLSPRAVGQIKRKLPGPSAKSRPAMPVEQRALWLAKLICQRWYGKNPGQMTSCGKAKQQQIVKKWQAWKATKAPPPPAPKTPDPGELARAKRYCLGLHGQDETLGGDCYDRQEAAIWACVKADFASVDAADLPRMARFCNTISGEDRGGNCACLLTQRERVARFRLPEDADFDPQALKAAQKRCEARYGDDRGGYYFCLRAALVDEPSE